ncbi:MAG: radical SAM protein [Candidatus Hermodarchaeota archaeon]
MISTVPINQILYRPPIEANSLLIAVTGGCSWNKCKFCSMYKTKDYTTIQEYGILPLEDVLNQVDHAAANNYHGFPVFLAGGNATSAPTDFLVKIIKHVRLTLKDVKRISCYAKSLDILRKTDDELRQLAEAGLDIVYMGLESGDSNILRKMRKGTNAESMIKAGRRILDAGIKLSLYVLLGLGGRADTKSHALETARVLTAINPTVFRFRTLHITNINPPPLYDDIKNGSFELLSPVECIREEREIIANLGDNVTSEVYNDHMNNYCHIKSQNIKENKETFIKTLDSYINDPQIQKMQRKNFNTM